MTKEQNIGAIKEIVRDCGIHYGEDYIVTIEFVGEEILIDLSPSNKLIVFEDKGETSMYLKDYAPFEIEGMYEALLKKYKK